MLPPSTKHLGHLPPLGASESGFLTRDDVRVGGLTVAGQVFAEMGTKGKPPDPILHGIDGILGLGFAAQESKVVGGERGADPSLWEGQGIELGLHTR